MTPEAEAGHADAVRVHEAAVSTYAAKVDAFTEASVTVAEARLREADAHSALDAVHGWRRNRFGHFSRCRYRRWRGSR
ncbi:MAG: hypothetical protein ACRDTT_19615, partial [Pseudonocardiaceae bacterium]